MRIADATGSPEEQMRKWRERQREEVKRAIVATKEEIPRADLDLSAFGGRQPVMLQRATNPSSRAELEQMRARREQRKARTRLPRGNAEVQGGSAVTRVLVRIAKVIADDVWDDPEAIGPDRELFWPRALKLRPTATPVPVRVDHIKTRDIGRVTALSDVKDIDGRWVIAHCDVDEPPVWLRRDTPASMSWCNLGPRVPMPGGWTRHISGMATKVSLLSPGMQPAEPGAKVWHIERAAALIPESSPGRPRSLLPRPSAPPRAR